MVKKKIIIDYSWINKKLSGGGLKSCENLHKIFITQKFKKEFDCIFLIKKSHLKYFNFNNLHFEIFPENFLLNMVKRFFFINFINKETEMIFITNIYSPLIHSKAKVINLVHDGQWLKYPTYFSLLRKLWLKFNFKIIKHKNNTCVFTTKFVRNQYKNILDKNSKKIIPLPIFKFNGILKKIKILEKKKFNLIISSDLPHKNLNIIKKSHKNRNQKYSHYFLVIVGIGQLKKTDKKNKIIYLGEISENEKFWLLNNCENYILPSLYEGFGMTLIEALSHSPRVVSSHIGSLVEIGNSNVNYIKKDSSYKNWNKIIFSKKNKNRKKINLDKKNKKIIDLYIDLFKA